MFYIGAFIYLMAVCSIPLISLFCDDVYDCTALRYDIAFIVISVILYATLHIMRLTTGNSIGEPEIIRMFLLAEFGSMFTVVSFGMFNSILDETSIVG
jgi:hypothetical protein